MTSTPRPPRRAHAPWLLLLLTGFAAGQAAATELTAGPLVGATDHATARVWVRLGAPGPVAVRVRAAGAAPDAPWTTPPPAQARADDDLTAVVLVEGLAPETEYDYEVIAPDAAAPLAAARFRTLPAPGQGKVSLAFGSCLHLGRFPEQPVFRAIAAARPSAFVFLGDNVYYTNADCEDPAAMWTRYRLQRQQPDLAALAARVPLFAQWDDHDYGPNDSDRTFPRRAHARRVFMGYWPAASYGEEGEGIYGRHVLGPLELFLLDDRSFRDPNREPNAPTKTILGARQRAWLVEGLAASAAPLKVVCTASQFLARYHTFESWQLARDEREAILDAIRDRKVRGVVFLSGDRHLAEVTRYPAERVGYPLWDVTASPLANRTFKVGGALTNPDRVFVHGDGNNFGWLEVDAAARTVRLELRDEQGATLWSVVDRDLLAE